MEKSTLLSIFVLFTLFISLTFGIHTSAICINACSNTFSPANLQICNQCANDPPIDFALCKYSCGNTVSSQNTIICNKCVIGMPLTSEWCAHACANTFSSQYRNVCNRC